MRSAFIVVAALISAPEAHAGRWEWTAPDSCPEATLRASLALRIDTTVDVLPFDVEISIADDGRGFTATLDISGAIADSRTLTSASCGELMDALAIVVARLASVVQRPPPPPTEPVPIAIVELGPVTARTITAAPRWNAGARVSGIVGTGAAPDVSIAAEVGAWGIWRSLALEIAVSRWKSNMVTLGDATAGVDIGLVAVAVRAGWRPAGSRWRGWLVGELGSMAGSGMGLDQSRSGSARWSAVGIGGALAWPVAEHVALVASSEVELLLDRVKFTLHSGSVLYRTPPLGLRASLGFEVGWR